MNYLLSRLREPSSWAGLASIISAAAAAAATKDPQAIGALVAGLAALLLPEKRSPASDA